MLGIGADPNASITALPASVAKRLHYKFRMVVEEITVDWNINLPYIAVSISGPMTGSYGDAAGTGTDPVLSETVT